MDAFELRNGHVEEKKLLLQIFSLVKDKVISSWEFPSSSVVRLCTYMAKHLGSISGWGPRSHAPGHSQKKKKEK